MIFLSIFTVYGTQGEIPHGLLDLDLLIVHVRLQNSSYLVHGEGRKYPCPSTITPLTNKRYLLKHATKEETIIELHKLNITQMTFFFKQIFFHITSFNFK